MRAKEDLRESLSKPTTLKYIEFSIKRRGFTGDSDTLQEITSAVAETMLYREDYYNHTFKHGIKTYIGQVITEVLSKLARNPDALNGELVFLDAPSVSSEEDGALTGHDTVCEDDVLRETQKFYTQAGVPSMMTYYLAKLPDQQSDVFAAKAVYGYSYKEICDLFDISLSYAEKLFLEAKRELMVFRRSEEAQEAQMQIGNTSGRIITNECSDAGVWNDWSWREEHAEAGPVHHYSQAEIADYCRTL